MKRKHGFHLLLHAGRILEGRLRDRLSGLGVQPAQARVIVALAHMGAVSQVELAREFDITPASMSTMTARLVDAGFILKTPNPSQARENVLRLSEKGLQLREEIESAWDEMDVLMGELLGTRQAEELTEGLHALYTALGARPPGVGWKNRPGVQSGQKTGKS